MTFHLGETVRVGNSTARVKNEYANGLIVLMDVSGTFEAGNTIVGDDSGESRTLDSFTIALEYDLYYEDYEWDDLDYIELDDGSMVVLDAHFTGNESEDWQTENIVVQG